MERIKRPFNAIERSVAIGLELQNPRLAVAQLPRHLLSLGFGGCKAPFQLRHPPGSSRCPSGIGHDRFPHFHRT